MSNSSETLDLSFVAVLGRAAAELEVQAAGVDAMHALTGGEGAGPARGETLRAAQSIDVVAQHLRALAGVLTGMAEAAPSDAAVPPSVLDAVLLSDLSARLRGAASSAAEDGDFELL